jgi:drug/metabolite transporter (DMT)-like permease
MVATVSRQAQAYLYAVASVLLWSTVATAFKLTLRHVDYIQMLLWSSIASVAILFVVLVSQGHLGKLREWSGGDVMRSALLGLLNPFLYYVVLFKAYSLLPAQQAQPLNYTWPITLTILSIPLLKQKVRARSIAAVLIAFVGVLVISTEGRLGTLRMDSPAGVALAVGSSVIWALYWILNMRDGREATVKLFSSFCFGTVYILIVAALTGRLVLPSTRALVGATYVGLFEMGLTFVLWLKALKLSRTTAQVSILIYFSPFISLVLIHFFLDERIMPATIAGLVLIVAGIAIQQYEDVARALKKG